MSDPVPLDLEYRTPAQLPASSDSWWHDVLGVARFGLKTFGNVSTEIPIANVAMPPIHTCDEIWEIWHAEGPMRSGQIGSAKFRANEKVLFGCMTIPERSSQIAHGDDVHSSLEEATRRAYGDIFRVLDATGFPQVVRIWNYMSGINDQAGNGERYWQFNGARRGMFLARDGAIARSAPAASALGTPIGSPLVIYFIASATAARTLENPRQVSAYHYPRRYGPWSPTFSRATLLSEALGYPLFVSGTASIVGHDSVHKNNVAAQTQETLANIEAVVKQANKLVGQQRYHISRLTYKVYVRYPSDMATIAAEICSNIGSITEVIFLHAEVCRRDLLVEIEAVGSNRVDPSASLIS